VIKSNSVFDIKDSESRPSPLNYSPKFHDEAPSFSMVSRKDDKTDKWVRSVPGPGSYSHLDLTNKEQKNPISNFRNVSGGRINHEKRKSETEELIRILNVPGPGQCSCYITQIKQWRLIELPSSNKMVVVTSARRAVKESSIVKQLHQVLVHSKLFLK